LALAAGTSLGPYRIIEPLGHGGMASVYKAYEAALDRNVAIKVLPPEFLHDPTFAERFRREAKVVARLEHPNIIPIFAFDIAEGVPWMAMRFVSGGTVSRLLRESSGRLSRERVIGILRGVSDALDYAHEKGVVHRDVKPHNMLVDEGGRVYLVDFGVAKMVEASSGLTATGVISGTPQYMAPEQITALNVDHRADIYSLGIVAYELLTGRVPFAADTPIAVLMKHVSDPVPLPKPEEVPEPMARTLLQCTAKNPEERWPSAGAFVDALERARVESEGVAPVPPPATVDLHLENAPASEASAAPKDQAATRPARRRGLGVMTLLFVLVLAGFLYLNREELIDWRELAARLFPEQAEDIRSPGPPPPVRSPAAKGAALGGEPSGASPSPAGPELTASPSPSRAGASESPNPETAVALPSSVPGLVEALGDADPARRARAATALGNWGAAAREAVPALTSALRDGESPVRTEAARALGRIGPEAKSAIPALRTALKDAEPLVAKEAAEALKRIGSRAGS
jgi:serine/threonine-protein kinase